MYFASETCSHLLLAVMRIIFKLGNNGGSDCLHLAPIMLQQNTYFTVNRPLKGLLFWLLSRFPWLQFVCWHELLFYHFSWRAAPFVLLCCLPVGNNTFLLFYTGVNSSQIQILNLRYFYVVYFGYENNRCNGHVNQEFTTFLI